MGAERDEHVIAEPGLIVVERVTAEAIEGAVRRVWRAGFFERSVPVGSM